MVVMTQEDSKFAHLLEPIRDLASNWDVNIADELEDYLEVLEAVKFSFEDGPSLNFAEAALVIQGSACVYSKKVEYLHKLVYQALEFIAEKRQREATRDGAEHADDPNDEFDDEEAFLNLDDVLEEGQGIDMDDGDSAQVALALRPPAAILAMDDTRHGQGDGEAGQYRIASFSVHHSGALLLESRDGDTLDAALRRTASRMSPGGPVGQGLSHMQRSSAGGGGQPSLEGAAVPGPRGADISDDDDLGGGGGPDWDDDGAGPSYDADGSFPDNDGPPWQQGGAEGEAGGAAAQAEVAAPAEEFDPWKPLDMHDKGSLLIRPFRRARRTTARRRQQAAAAAAGAHAAGLFSVAPPVPTGNGLAFPEFAGALRAQQAAKQQALRYEAANCRGAGRHDAVLAEMQDNAYNDGGDYDDDGGGYDGYGYDGEGGDDDDGAAIPAYDPEELESLAAAGGSSLPSGGGGGGGESYEDICKAHIDAFMHAAAAAEVQTELASRVAGWRHKILPLIEEQDAREAFHIHNYGDRILDRLTQLSLGPGAAPSAADPELPAAPVALASVLSHTDQWEISRMFASMLQLVNAGNVGLQRPGLEGPPNSPLQLQLLSLELQHTQLLGFKAPSLHDKTATASQRASKVASVQEAPAGGEENQVAAAVTVPKATKRRKGSNR